MRTNKSKTSIYKVFSAIKKSFLGLFEETLLTSSVQEFNPDTYYRIGLKKIVEFESLYSKGLEQYIRSKYKIDSEIFSTDSVYYSSVISHMKGDDLVNTLVNYQPKLTNLKRNLRINNPKQLEMLNNLLTINTIDFDGSTMNESDYLDVMISVPESLLSGASRNGLIQGFSFEYMPIRYEGSEGWFLRGKYNEYTKYMEKTIPIINKAIA